MGRTTVLTGWVSYVVSTKSGAFPRRIDRYSVPAVKQIPSVNVERRLGSGRVPACAWCKARPSVWDLDCDGAYNTYRCHAPQCAEAYRRWIDGEGPKPSYY